jgi:hypothetical protein
MIGDQIQITSTCNVARLIGLEAAKRKVKAYARVQHPLYETSTSSKESHDEKEDAKPIGTIGTWWHETLRMLAAIEEFVLPSNIWYASDPHLVSTSSSCELVLHTDLTPISALVQ